ncbi:restriction endonuclease subunit S [Vibrio sp. sp1]|uniref:restriction endonuclease subunit S n=1 Tax=Vibrio sp. sp1 TaxID=2766781 RepID=UPI001965820D|nr:restriction endonuclease subunit S [Vibrio sp. sp1]ELP3329421.1 restriction endonuclease subunit S [Vibrio alginolyticus]QRZ23626.1 restriction endonuclease subunit S [Vibrio sp. sp1]
MISYWLPTKSIKERVYIPKYYNPQIQARLDSLRPTHDIVKISSLIDDDILEVNTGHEIGKLAYGTGDIPFVRTSDITNWETKTAPKQGVSEDIYLDYKNKQDVQLGDILLVRDGTYLIGTNCIITELDEKIVYQSHILKIRVKNKSKLNPYLLFIIINSPLFQAQIRSVQFTADTIDTIGNRFFDLQLAIPKDKVVQDSVIQKAQEAMKAREVGKAFIKHAPTLMEESLSQNSRAPIDAFLSSSWEDILTNMHSDTVTSEFGNFETFWLDKSNIRESIYLPKYYDPDVTEEISQLARTCDCISIGKLIEDGILEVNTGDEIGKMAYGTGTIPFLRTSDFSNWEIKHDPKQGVSQEIYQAYARKQDMKAGDILLVRDGTYLVGTSCIVTKNDSKALYCGGLYKIRVKDEAMFDQWLLLGLLNSYIVKRQIRTKQFTRDVIDTIGKRLEEIIIPIPKSNAVRTQLSEKIKSIVDDRIEARKMISSLAENI